MHRASEKGVLPPTNRRFPRYPVHQTAFVILSLSAIVTLQERNAKKRRDRAAKKGIHLSDADLADPDYRNNAPPMNSTERSRKSRQDDTYRAREYEAAKARQRELSPSALEERRQQRNEDRRRCYARSQMASKEGDQAEYSSWLIPYLAETQRYEQTNPEAILRTIQDFQKQGYSVIRGALSRTQVDSVIAEANETAGRATESTSWQDMFGAKDKNGRLLQSAERQMATMAKNGYTSRLAEDLVSTYLGEMDHFGLRVGTLSLMDTHTRSPQAWHADYELQSAKAWKTGFPVGGIICFEEGSKFETYEGGLDDPLRTPISVALNPGDVVLFHGAKVSQCSTHPLVSENSNLGLDYLG